jgi:hypothetical protein
MSNVNTVSSHIKNALLALERAMSAKNTTLFKSNLSRAEVALNNAKAEVGKITGKGSIPLRKSIMTLKRSIDTMWTKNERTGIVTMRFGETYKPPVTDGLKITKNERNVTNAAQRGTYKELLAIVRFYQDQVPEGEEMMASDYLALKNEIRTCGKIWTSKDFKRAGFSAMDVKTLPLDIAERQNNARRTPLIVDGVAIKNTCDYHIRNFRKIQNAEGGIEVVIDTQDGTMQVDGKELAAVLAQVAEQSTGPGMAVKAMEIVPLDASSPITEIVQFPEPNVKLVPGPDYVGDFVPSATSDVVGIGHVSTTPDSTDSVLADEMFIATNQRTNNAAADAPNIINQPQELHDLLRTVNSSTIPYGQHRFGENAVTALYIE